MMRSVRREGWEGWDEYAPFYDWENLRTLGRRDVPFWRRMATRAVGSVLELGCGTGRISFPLAQAGVPLVGLDRSASMLERARTRAAGKHPTLVRGDIRALPFDAATFSMVLAPYGVLQSVLSDRDLTSTLESVARVITPAGIFAIDLVPDVPSWREYRNRVQLRGRAGRGAHFTLIESVRQNRRRRLTTFKHRYVVSTTRGASEHRFVLTFRTLTVRQMTSRLERAGFEVEAVIGDYRGRSWSSHADVWIILARRI
jgi:SAM-dependent methyltransferase